MPSTHMEGEEAKTLRGEEKAQADALKIVAFEVKTSQQPVIGADPLPKAVWV